MSSSGASRLVLVFFSFVFFTSASLGESSVWRPPLSTLARRVLILFVFVRFSFGGGKQTWVSFHPFSKNLTTRAFSVSSLLKLVLFLGGGVVSFFRLFLFSLNSRCALSVCRVVGRSNNSLCLSPSLLLLLVIAGTVCRGRRLCVPAH